MANVFVWSGATGLNDGSSWDNAYTTLMRDWGAEAGFTLATDFVYVRSVHAETPGSNVTIRGSTSGGTEEPVRVICVVGDTTGTTPGALATGASVTPTGSFDIIILEQLYVYGVDFISPDNISISNSGNSDVVLEKCSLQLTGGSTSDVLNLHTTGNSDCFIRLVDTNISFNLAGQKISSTGGANIEWLGGTLTGDQTVLLLTRFVHCKIYVKNVDLTSMITGSLVDVSASATGACDILFTRCLMASGFSAVSGTMDQAGREIRLVHCQIGTDADPAYQIEFNTSKGKVVSDTARYRTDGASDGERTNPLSWDMDTTVGSKRQYPGHPLHSPPIAGWTDGDGATAHVYRIFFASGATQQDDDIWFELIGPNDAATNSLGVKNSARVDPETAASNHTSDTESTWNGTDVGTKQYMEVTYTPDKPGPISAIVYMSGDAGSTGHIYIDPKIYIDP